MPIKVNLKIDKAVLSATNERLPTRYIPDAAPGVANDPAEVGIDGLIIFTIRSPELLSAIYANPPETFMP